MILTGRGGTEVRFTKLQALGNDFLVVEEAELPAGAALGPLTAALCERHYGAGADGVLFVGPPRSDESDCESRIFNADGGEAEVSGNGTRCVAAWLDAEGRWPEGRDTVRVGTAAGVRAVRLAAGGGGRRDFEIDLGAPRLASADVPMLADPPLARAVGFPLDVAGERLRATALSVGNPHCSLLVADLDSVDVARLGPAIERHPLFPARTNVEFVEVVAPDRVRVLLWERGVGETLSSGTGASAAAVAARLDGRVSDEVTVETRAGELRVTWRGEGEPVLLAGPAEPVYRGAWLGPVPGP